LKRFALVRSCAFALRSAVRRAGRAKGKTSAQRIMPGA
jgi:hypothetical protein